MRPAGAYVVWSALALAALGTIAARRRRPARWQPVALTGIATASVVAFAFVSWGRATPFGDFNTAYYAAGTSIFTNPSRLYACETRELCFVNIPIVAALFTPLVVLGRLPAQIVFSIVGALAAAAAAWLLIRELRATAIERYAIIALFALNGPLLYSARLGNLTHVMLPFLVAAFVALARGRDGGAGVVIGALAIIKPPLLLFLPYLVFRQRWRAATAMGGTVIVAAVGSVAWFGWELHRVGWFELAGKYSNRPVGAYNVQSIAGMLAHFNRPGALSNWAPLDVSPTFMAVYYGLLAIVFAAAATTLFASGTPATPRAQWTELSIVLVLVLLAGPVTWTHYYAFCVIPLACYAARAMSATGTVGRFAVGAAAVLVSAPVVLWLPKVSILDWLAARVLISHYVFGGLLLLGALCVSRSISELPGRQHIDGEVTPSAVRPG
jgi:hypothetical protein